MKKILSLALILLVVSAFAMRVRVSGPTYVHPGISTFSYSATPEMGDAGACNYRASWIFLSPMGDYYSPLITGGVRTVNYTSVAPNTVTSYEVEVICTLTYDQPGSLNPPSPNATKTVYSAPLRLKVYHSQLGLPGAIGLPGEL